MPTIVNITLSIPPSFAWQDAKLWEDPTRRAAIFARFWSHVNRADAKACWLYTGAGNGRGYGLFAVGVGNTRVMAHRFSWLASRGEIPPGQEVCHKCDVQRCVNPDHLFLDTRQGNHLDAVRKGRKKAWGRQKLNAEDVRAIRARSCRGELQRVIAADYGIARHTVSQIVHRKMWAHLSDLPTQDPREVHASFAKDTPYGSRP